MIASNIINKQKQEIFGGIAALKTLTDNQMGKLISLKDSSATKQNTIVGSLLEIYNQLGGYDELIETIEIVLNKKLDEIEEIIKGTIKTSLKQVISCGVEPSITSDMILNGVTFNLKDIDPISVLSIDPLSDKGNLVYFDNDNGLNSDDYNVFLYTIIKSAVSANINSANGTWKDSDGNEIFKLTYTEHNQTTSESNQINIKIDSSYQDEKLSAFISEYLDSVKLFNNTQLLSSIFDDILGSKIFSYSKTKEQIAAEKLIEKLIENILNNVDEDDVIDDSFYSFSNDVYNDILETSERKKKGILKYDGDEQIDATINENEIMSYMVALKDTNSTKITQQTQIIKDAIDNITNKLVEQNNISDKDKFALKLDFIKKIIEKLMTTITTYIFSPKIIYLFIMTSKLLGINDSGDIVQFIKNNINIYKIIITKIRDIIITEITNKILNMIAPMITQVVTILTKEKMVTYKKQFDSVKNLIELVV